MARAHFRQAVAKENSLGTMAVARRGGRAPGVKAEAESSSSSGSSSSSQSISLGGTGSVNVGVAGVRMERADSLDNSIIIEEDPMKMDITEGRLPLPPTLPSSPSSSAKALRDSQIATSLAHRAVALSVGLVGAGIPDGVNRYEIMD